MDFETCFFECCNACNCSSENFQLPREIQGQGDCNTRVGVDEQNIWMSPDKGKKLKSKVREKDKSGFKGEKQKTLEDSYCDCVKKTTKKEDFADKRKHETKLENKTSEVFEDCNNPWNFPYASWNNSKTEKVCVSEEPNSYVAFKTDKVLVDTVVEIKEKVDILFQIFQEYGEKPSPESFEESSQIKAVGAIFGNFWHLFDFNKRLSATEEGIEKLTLIIEDLLKKCNRMKSSSEDVIYRNPLTFEEMTIGERINFLKTRNDLILSLMRDFLKVGSVEEICSKLALLPKISEVNQVYLNSELRYKEKCQGNYLSREELLDTLKKLKTPLTKIQENKSQHSNHLHTGRNERRGENTLKYFGSKLEVISEQAELALNNELENANLDDFRKKKAQNLKENFSERREESEESDVNIYEVTSRLLAQEALLKSSLDKVHFELFSKLDTSEKKYTKGNLNIINKTEIQKNEENQSCRLETNLKSSSSSRNTGCIYCETEYAEKSKCNQATVIDGNYVKHNEFKESIKEKNNSFENLSENSCEQTYPDSSKKANEYEESKPKSPNNLNQSKYRYSKAIHKNSFSVLSPTSKPKRAENYPAERCSSSREGSKNENELKDKRPVTAPNSYSKIMPPSGLKPPITEKSKRKNLGLSNVKNKNKILLSKKSFVETS